MLGYQEHELAIMIDVGDVNAAEVEVSVVEGLGTAAFD